MDELAASGNVQGETISEAEDAMQADELDQCLGTCDPAGELTDKQRQLLVGMVVACRPAGRRRHARPVVAGAVAVLVLGGIGAGAAAATDAWVKWARKDPYIAIQLQLPRSGQHCEFRYGNLQGAPPEVEKVIRDTLANARFSDDDIIRAARAVGAGDPLTDDDAYETGVTMAVSNQVHAALAAHGLTWDKGSFEGQGICE